jgi:hypothetical protein
MIVAKGDPGTNSRLRFPWMTLAPHPVSCLIIVPKGDLGTLSTTFFRFLFGDRSYRLFLYQLLVIIPMGDLRTAATVLSAHVPHKSP